MSSRSIHVINHECDIYVEFIEGDVRVRITEKNPELPNPTDIEIEGDPDHIAEAFATIAGVISNRQELGKEPN